MFRSALRRANVVGAVRHAVRRPFRKIVALNAQSVRPIFQLQGFASSMPGFQQPIAMTGVRYMSAETIPVPALGDSISEGTVVQWLKAPGEFVESDEIVAVLETDKVSVDIRSPKSGKIVELLAEEGDSVEVGAELFKLEAGDVPASAKTEAAAPAAEAAAPVAEAPKAAAPKASTPAPKASTPAPKTSSPSPSPGSRSEKRVPMSRMRLRIAERLKEAQNVNAMLTTFNEIDMSGLMEMRSQYKDDFFTAHGAKLGFMSAFVKASTKALQDNPDINAVIDGKDVLYRDYVDISVAVATPTGLVVPVLRDCQNMGFHDVESGIAQLGEKARNGQLALEDMTGGTFTISNGGVYGSLMGTPIINPPQSAILGMHGIFKRPVVVDDQIVIRPMMYVALTYDHRLVDGRGAVTFLKKVKDLIEDPRRLLLDL